MTVLVVTGTGTGVGKTVVTAAIAAAAIARGARVAVVKPAQTGLGAGQPGDLQEVAPLSGCTDVHEFVRYPAPLSPAAAARLAGTPPMGRAEMGERIGALARDRDVVLVEGAGGLLVRFDSEGLTIADLAADLGAPLVVVTDPALGTLNHTALSLEALATRTLACAGVVLGSWPAEPDLACRSNLIDLPAIIGGPLAGCLPAGSGTLGRAQFADVAEAGLAPSLGGRFNGTINNHFPPRTEDTRA